MITLHGEESLDEQMKIFARNLTNRIVSVANKPDRVYGHCLQALLEAYKDGALAQQYQTVENLQQWVCQKVGQTTMPELSKVPSAVVNSLLKHSAKHSYGFVWNRYLDSTYEQYLEFYPDDVRAFHDYIVRRWRTTILEIIKETSSWDLDRVRSDNRFRADQLKKNERKDSMFNSVLHLVVLHPDEHNYELAKITSYLLKRCRIGKLRQRLLNGVVKDYHTLLSSDTVGEV